jgi:hypothetical protein
LILETTVKEENTHTEIAKVREALPLYRHTMVA